MIMMAKDGRWHPIVTGNSLTAGAKTINSQPFVVNSPILINQGTATFAENATITATNLHQAINQGTNFRYNQNVQSGWTAHKPVYLKGTINDEGLFVLAGNGTTGGDYMTQDLPTTEDGFVYIMFGMMTTATTSFRLFQSNTILEFKDGKLQPYNPVTAPDLSGYYNKTSNINATGYNLTIDNVNFLGGNITFNGTDNIWDFS